MPDQLHLKTSTLCTNRVCYLAPADAAGENMIRYCKSSITPRHHPNLDQCRFPKLESLSLTWQKINTARSCVLTLHAASIVVKLLVHPSAPVSCIDSTVLADDCSPQIDQAAEAFQLPYLPFLLLPSSHIDSVISTSKNVQPHSVSSTHSINKARYLPTGTADRICWSDIVNNFTWIKSKAWCLSQQHTVSHKKIHIVLQTLLVCLDSAYCGFHSREM